MSTVHSFVSSPSGAAGHLLDKFKELSEEVLKRPFTGLSGSIPALQDANVRQCVVSGSHVAFLLEDGRICRVGFSEKPPCVLGGKEKSDDDAASTSSARSLGSRGGSPRPEADDRVLSSIMHRWGSIIGSSGTSGSRLASRGRFVVRRRGAGRPLLSRWPLTPAVDVPEELVDQALAVLQGKSREVVTRELQRTNMDVNQAVNNLLSRDDDDGGREGEHEDNLISFLHSGEELLNLLGSGSLSGLAEEELEDVLGRREDAAAAGRESRAGMYDLSDPMVQDEIRSWVTLGDGAAGGSTTVPSAVEGNKKRKKEQTSGGSPFNFDLTLQWWPLEADQKFQMIAGLYSELIAVDNHGCLRRWLWAAAAPQPGPHPACERLQMRGDGVRILSARTLRASVVTESGKVATWVDDCVAAIGGKLEHPAQVFSELSGECVVQLHVCELFTAVLTESGKVFWWGILPFSERKLAMMQAQDSSKLLGSASTVVGVKQESITVGSVVCMRSKPIYCIGTKAIHIKGGVLQCGILQEQVFSLLEKCRFKRLSIVQPAVDSSEGTEQAPVGTKRKYSEDCSEDEEVWSLKDVVFIEDQNMSCLGTVVKLDGKYAAVHFPALSSETGDDMASTDLGKCRLLRKDELMLVTDSTSVQLPSCAQDCPKRLKMSSYHRLMAMACDSRGVHVVHSLHSAVRYTLYSLDVAKAAQSSQFSDVTSRYLLQQTGPLRLWPVGLGNVWLLLDAMGGLYPLQKDSAGGMKDLPMLHLPPALDVGIGMEGSDGKGTVVVVAFRKQHLISALLHCDLASVKSIVEQGRGSPLELTRLLSEKCSGGCNIFHLLAFLDAPAEPVPAERRGGASRNSPRGMGLREMMRQASMLPSACRLWGAMDETEDADLLCVASATSFVEYLGSLEDHCEVLKRLLMEKNAEGFTPFMAAIACKAYSVATKLFEVARSLSKGSDQLLLSMLYPPESHRDDNPVFMLCRNDTCSFTWTGEEHIYQDIFECRTCGLTGSLCCCTECAYTCHRGHDCSFKRASPTAYCDCWEKCKCQALAPGTESHRLALLTQLLKFRALSSITNGRGEHLLEMLLGTVARQSKEQNQWHSMRSSYRHQSRKEDQTAIMPAHDLSPPQFVRKALQLTCEEWTCIEAALAAGEERDEPKVEAGAASPWSAGSSKQSGVVMNQASTRHLDALTYTLLCKTPQDIVDCLLTTLVKQIGPLRTNARAIAVTERFLRSVIRVLCVCYIEAIPSSQAVGGKKKSPSLSPLQLADRIFSSLVPLAVPQLISQARTVLTPVCMGVCMPIESASSGSDKHKIAEELFRLPQADLLRVSTIPGGGGGGGGEHTQLTEGGISESESESGAGDGEESTSGGPAHDASSTATVGSNPLPYLSDHDSTDNEELDSGDEGSMDGDGAQDDGYVMVDAGMLHRPSVSSHWALPTTKTARSAQQRDQLNTNTSAAMLAQIFSMLVRQASDLVMSVGGLLHSPTPPFVLPVMEGDGSRLASQLWTDLAFIWQWLAATMDSTEALVRLGCALGGKSSQQKEEGTSTDANRLNEVPSESVESRKAFLSYLLTLSRGSHNEHGGLAPAINVASMEHVAWCLDAMVYTLQHTHVQPAAANTPHRFFRRTNSTTCLGYPPASPFAPLAEALPLADRPHLLHPKQCREAMFGFTQQEMLDTWPVCTLPPPPVVHLISSPIPCGVTLQWPSQQHPSQAPCHQQNSGKVLSDDVANYVESHHLAAGVVLGRWCMTVDLFSQAFADTTGKEKDSVLAHLKSFEKAERELRREMEALHSAAHRDIVVEVERCREKLLTGTFRVLNSFCDSKHSTGSSQPLCVHRIKVFFKNEPGEGSGVTRSLFTALSEALLSDEPLPKLDPVLKAKRPLSPSGRFRSREKQKSSVKVEFLDQVKLAPVHAIEPTQDMSAECPLFYQPGKPGFYSLRAGVNSPGRLNAYRNVGRILGLCMLFSEVLPIPLCRHVYKYLLHREISWHDLAFFDPVMYESMRKLIVDLRRDDPCDNLSNVGLNFCVSLREEEGGGVHNLMPNGADCPVTSDNIFLYIQRYAELRMVKVHQEPLEHMRQGLHDVLAESSLQNLTAEDMRLILCGCPQIDVDVLKKITLFNDESRKGFEALQRFKIWFWSVVERLSQKERQELLYFWTSSSAMPANADSYQPAPSVTLRPADDQHLPTANTCISRLYVPYYSSKNLLKAKLLMAIRTKTFGFV